jgi:hypothetical protein
LTFALGGILAIREPRWLGVWIYCAANFGMLLLIIGVSLYHLDRFGAGLTTWVWFSLCVIGVIGFGIPLVRPPNQLRQQET